MWWFILVLICSGICAAQPVSGPYVIDDCIAPNEFQVAKVKVDNAGNAHLFYSLSAPDGSSLFYARVHLVDGAVLYGPELVSHDSILTLQVEDIALSPEGQPLALIHGARPGEQQVIMFELSDAGWDSTFIIGAQDGWSPNFGSLSRWLHTPRFIGCGSDFVQLYLFGGGVFDIGIGMEATEGPFVCFVQNDTVMAYGAEGFYGIMEYGLLLSQSLNADSLHIWINDQSIWGGGSKFLVTSSGEFNLLDSFSCCDIPITHFSLGPESFAVLCYEPSNVPRYRVTHRYWNTCEELGDIFGALDVYACSAHPTNGFLIPILQDHSISVTRLDSMGNYPFQDGTVVWEPMNTDFLTVSSDVSDQGLVGIVWTERDSDNQVVDHVSIAAFPWDAPLDSHESPAPIPQSISLTAYPNPFNASVQIVYELPRTGDVQLSVFNTLGQQVATLFNGRAVAGTHTLNWSPDAASGIYFVKLQSGEFVTSRKILYVR